MYLVQAISFDLDNLETKYFRSLKRAEKYFEKLCKFYKATNNNVKGYISNYISFMRSDEVILLLSEQKMSVDYGE